MSRELAVPISSAAVHKATGKTWIDWLQILDAAGAKTMTHQEIVAVLSKKHKVGPWWQQMVTVGYERLRGLRVTHQTAKGYSVSASKTMNVPISKLYRAWTSPRICPMWLNGASLSIRKSTKNRSVRLNWDDDDTRIDAMFFEKSRGKSQVAVEHNRLPSAAAAKKMKAFWKERLGKLERLLER